jgi:hypothetical protein
VRVSKRARDVVVEEEEGRGSSTFERRGSWTSFLRLSREIFSREMTAS